MILLENANRLFERWTEERQPQYLLELKRTIKYTPTTPKPHKQIPIAVWSEWEQTIRKNCYLFERALTYDEIFDNVKRLKIKGIGNKTIKETADFLADKFKVSFNSGCLFAMTPKARAVIKRNGLNIDSLSHDDFVKKNQLFEKLSMREIFDFLDFFAKNQ